MSGRGEKWREEENTTTKQSVRWPKTKLSGESAYSSLSSVPETALGAAECGRTVTDGLLCFNYIIDRGRSVLNSCLCAPTLLYAHNLARCASSTLHHNNGCFVYKNQWGRELHILVMQYTLVSCHTQTITLQVQLGTGNICYTCCFLFVRVLPCILSLFSFSLCIISNSKPLKPTQICSHFLFFLRKLSQLCCHPDHLELFQILYGAWNAAMVSLFSLIWSDLMPHWHPADFSAVNSCSKSAPFLHLISVMLWIKNELNKLHSVTVMFPIPPH